MRNGTRLLFILILAAALPLGAQTVSSLPEPVPTSGPSGWSEDPIRYDGAGNIVTIGNQPFLYDTTGRLLSATITRPDQPGAQTQSYAYDFYGNMTTRTTNGVQTALTTDPATNHLYGPSYDEAGNLTQWQPPGAAHTYTYTYDAFNMITDETTTAVAGSHVIHVYTADDERLWTYDLGANVSHWTIRDLGGKVLRDYQVTGSTWQIARDYFYRDGSLLAAITPTRTEHYSLDHLGTPRVITDGSGFRVGFHHYYPFGEEWKDASGAQEGNPLKFTGHERDADLASSVYGLDYMHARYYSATLGRFLQSDPVEGGLGAPQTWNAYAYAQNNPVVRTDPRGLADGIVITAPPPPVDVNPTGLFSFTHYDLYFSLFSGTANAVASNNFFGILRQDAGHWAWQYGDAAGDAFDKGQTIGDFLTLLQGITEFSNGVAGVGLIVLSDGTLLPVISTPTAVLLVHGGATTVISTTHLMGKIQQRKPGTLGQRKGSDGLNRENKKMHNAIRAAGVDPGDKDLVRRIHDAQLSEIGDTFRDLVQKIIDFVSK